MSHAGLSAGAGGSCAPPKRESTQELGQRYPSAPLASGRQWVYLEEMQQVATAAAEPAASATDDAQKPLVFTRAMLRDALNINSPKLIKELYDIVQRRITYETGRQQRIDAKATSLLTASGVSVTLAFTFTAAISSPQGVVLFHGIFNYLLGTFGAALACGFAAAACAIRALLVTKGYSTPSDDVIFDAKLLRDANAIEPDPDPKKGETEAMAEDWRLMKYQRQVIEHFWWIGDNHARTHERKALWVRTGQWAFAGFLILLMAVCGWVGFAVYSQDHAPQAAARAAAGNQAAAGSSRDPSGRQRPNASAAYGQVVASN